MCVGGVFFNWAVPHSPAIPQQAHQKGRASSEVALISDLTKSTPVSRTAPGRLPFIRLLIRPLSVTTFTALRVAGARPGCTGGEGEVTLRVSGQFIAGPKHNQKQIIHIHTQSDGAFKAASCLCAPRSGNLRENRTGKMCKLGTKESTFVWGLHQQCWHVLYNCVIDYCFLTFSITE